MTTETTDLTVTSIPISQVRMDGGTQPRAGLDQETLEEYTALVKNKYKNFPPIEVVYDGMDYWVYDGFHRLEASKRAKKKDIKANVRPGTSGDAQWLSYAANRTNGLRRSNEDKQRAVQAALRHSPDRSDQAIADHVGVDRKTVAGWRKKLEEAGDIPVVTERIGADDRVYEVPRSDADEEEPPDDASLLEMGEDGTPGQEGAVAPPLPDQTAEADDASLLEMVEDEAGEGRDQGTDGEANQDDDALLAVATEAPEAEPAAEAAPLPDQVAEAPGNEVALMAEGSPEHSDQTDPGDDGSLLDLAEQEPEASKAVPGEAVSRLPDQPVPEKASLLEMAEQKVTSAPVSPLVQPALTSQIATMMYQQAVEQWQKVAPNGDDDIWEWVEVDRNLLTRLSQEVLASSCLQTAINALEAVATVYEVEDVEEGAEEDEEDTEEEQ